MRHTQMMENPSWAFTFWALELKRETTHVVASSPGVVSSIVYDVEVFGFSYSE